MEKIGVGAIAVANCPDVPLAETLSQGWLLLGTSRVKILKLT